METQREIRREADSARPRWVPTPPPPPGPWDRLRMLLRRSLFPLALLLFAGAIIVLLVRLPGFGTVGSGGSEASPPAAEETEAAEGGAAAETVPLTIESEPSGAQVLLDGQEVGTTPLREVDVEQGAYILSLEMENYRMPDTLVVLSAGSPASFTLSMRSLSAPEGPPPPEPQSEGPSQAVDPGEMSASAEDELPAPEEEAPADPPAGEETVDDAPSSDGALDEGALDEELSAIELEELFNEEEFELGDIVVSSEPSGATVFLNGVRRGTTPITLADLQIGEKEITLQMEGYQEHFEEVEVEADQIHDVTATLEPLQGQLRVLARPWGSIYIDDELHEAETNVRYTVDLPIGTYTVRAAHPTLGSQEREVTIRQGEVTSLVIDLNE